jgi:hypothetical protein
MEDGERVVCVVSCRSVPRGEGVTFLLYTKERTIYKCAALFGYVGRHGVQSRGDDACPASLAPVKASWRPLYLNRGGFEGEDVVVDRGVSMRAQGSR